MGWLLINCEFDFAACFIYTSGVMPKIERQLSQYQLQKQRLFSPHLDIQKDYDRIYIQGQIDIGWPIGQKRMFDSLARPDTVAVLGVALGDEGKGRFVDNKIEELAKKPKIDRVYVVRYQGGNNAGHTVENDQGVKLALHVVPSGVMHQKAIGIIDKGVAVHAEDLKTEVGYVEDKVGDLRGRLVISLDALLVTDLERAEEVLNRERSSNTRGGTGRGISPVYAHYYDRLGLRVSNLLDQDWRKSLSRQYDHYQRQFAAFDKDLATTAVPDFKAIKNRGSSQVRTVGTKEEFLDRLETARDWLISREMVVNTFVLHEEVLNDNRYGVIFEGAQALGLHPWLGTIPDVTSSDTSANGILQGTGVWRVTDIADRVGIFKATYTSSVGSRHMPTHIDLKNVSQNSTPDQEWGMWVREEAHEYGTTTGRPRDILYLDLPMLIYNSNMAGVEMLAATHLDIAKESMPIRICTYYANQAGDNISYQPGLRYLENVIPQYIDLPGWDGILCRDAKSLEELPQNAIRYLAFLQTRTGFPIVAATTGPARQHLVKFAEH